jgi:hypothetical protein
VGFIALLIILWIIIMGFYFPSLRPDNTSVETTLGTRVVKTDNGNWEITITGGSKPVASLTIQVVNITGQSQLTKKCSDIKNQIGDPDSVFNDTDNNNLANAGDTILLKTSGGHVHKGDAVHLLNGNLIVGKVDSLP